MPVAQAKPQTTNHKPQTTNHKPQTRGTERSRDLFAGKPGGDRREEEVLHPLRAVRRADINGRSANAIDSAGLLPACCFLLLARALFVEREASVVGEDEGAESVDERHDDLLLRGEASARSAGRGARGVERARKEEARG
eukprot:3304910-Rhodomonas_salina.2